MYTNLRPQNQSAQADFVLSLLRLSVAGTLTTIERAGTLSANSQTCQVAQSNLESRSPDAPPDRS
jgi:uncharacterized membrane protein